eukprot:1392560-Pyramimonas_sp.AAC.1
MDVKREEMRQGGATASKQGLAPCSRAPHLGPRLQRRAAEVEAVIRKLPESRNQANGERPTCRPGLPPAHWQSPSLGPAKN